MPETKIKQQVYSYKIELDIRRDAWNWYITCNNHNISHGVDFSQKIPIEIISKIKDKSEGEANEFIIPFLEQKYIKDKEEINQFTSQVKNDYAHKFSLACQKIVELTGKPLYRNDFTTFITTAPRAPYRYISGYTWLPIGWFDPIKTFMHELLHFQFIHYWRMIPKSEVNKLSNEQFEYLKESLTVILDDDLRPIIQMPDKGYEKHKDLRQELHAFWKENKDFDKLVIFGLGILSKYTN